MSEADIAKRRFVAGLIDQVQAIVEESGDPTNFDAGKWVRRWIKKPLPALGGLRPADFMNTSEGRHLISTFLSMAESGAYA
ncbi:MbcA/ParS/Xre antitoxin family protein [Caballeronia sp. J97]|uniref:MbcA/ParS/Xre antitoxin family protein n=1 Tax=Caballeronia sp. J97 TaxID=2805429 RepID=UPI002AAF3407|nr:MbcA/ParS/Xre antitoxin family protein [Caballeronia sp. J97]